ncbi:hypothetical protein GVAV_001734 [Gurleya vavrai]
MILIFLINNITLCKKEEYNSTIRIESTHEDEEEFLFLNNREIENLALQRLEFQKNTINGELFTDYESFINFLDPLIQRNNYFCAIKHIENIISFSFTDCFLKYDIKELFCEKFITFIYFPDEDLNASDNENLNKYETKIKELLTLAAVIFEYRQKLYEVIDKNKNDLEKLKNMLYPSLAKKFWQKQMFNSKISFSEFSYDLKYDLFDFFNKKYTLIEKEDSKHLNNIKNIQKKLLEFKKSKF